MYNLNLSKMSYGVPIVSERDRSGHFDIFSTLLKQRIIFINSEIDSYEAGLIIAQLLFLESQNSKQDIVMYINSPGGVVTDGFGIVDTMNYIKPDVSTVCVGLAASMGAFILASGAAGKRFALANSEIMIHQPLGGYSGQCSDMQIEANHIQRLKHKMNTILSNVTGQPLEKIQQDTDRNNWLTAKEAQEYGLIDKIIHQR